MIQAEIEDSRSTNFHRGLNASADVEAHLRQQVDILNQRINELEIYAGLVDDMPPPHYSASAGRAV